jgi:hypothetical protein
MDLTGKLKSALWKCYGDPSYPAEWDGKTYGGGKLSQRFWEYHQTIELLELTPDSVVLDIGGGSPATGAGFFTRVIAPHVREVHVIDVNIGETQKASSNIRFHRSLASYETLTKLLKENPQITHVACISVFEHIPHEVRCGMVRALNEAFTGSTFVATLEFHSKESYFEHQLITKTVSEMFGSFTTFYPDAICKSPFWCENAYHRLGRGQRILRRVGQAKEKEAGIPLWYPVAFRFRRETK